MRVPSKAAAALIGPAMMLVFHVASANAQLTRGFISGVVQDPTGAVVPGALVRATNLETGQASETVTNSQGVYRLVALELGTYDVEFSKQGFERRKVTKVEVSATQEVTLNESLAVGTTETTLVVTDAPPGVELSKST